jgi:hypothetical protein
MSFHICHHTVPVSLHFYDSLSLCITSLSICIRWPNIANLNFSTLFSTCAHTHTHTHTHACTHARALTFTDSAELSVNLTAILWAFLPYLSISSAYTKDNVVGTCCTVPDKPHDKDVCWLGYPQGVPPPITMERSFGWTCEAQQIEATLMIWPCWADVMLSEHSAELAQRSHLSVLTKWDFCSSPKEESRQVRRTSCAR